MLSLLVFSLRWGHTLCLPQSSNIRELWRFPDGTLLEKIAMRPNGNLLVADATAASLWDIAPSAQPDNNNPASRSPFRRSRQRRWDRRAFAFLAKYICSGGLQFRLEDRY